MTNKNEYDPYAVRARRATVLFWIIVIVFVATALLAIIALASSIGMIQLKAPPDKNLYVKIVWALWGTVLAEVVILFVLISKDQLGLAAEPKIRELRNTLGEVVDGLEANGDLNSAKARELRISLGPRATEVNPVLFRGS